MLVEHLPPGSAVHRAQLGVSWTTTDELLAMVFDALQIANWQRPGRKNLPRPKPYPRPGRDRGPKTYGTALSVEEMRVVLDNWGSPEN